MTRRGWAVGALVAGGVLAPHTTATAVPRPADPVPATAQPNGNPPTDAALISGLDPLPVVLPFPDPAAVEPEVLLGTIEIPVLGVTRPLYEGVAEMTLDRGPGHIPGTAQPGQLGNVVVGGHRVSHGRPFRDLDRLVPGDAVVFVRNGQRFTYVVEQIEIITPHDVRIVEQTRAYTATLFACHPPGSTRQRIVAHLRFAP